MKKFLFGKRMWLMLLATLLVFGGLFGMQWYGQQMMNRAMDNMPQQVVTITAAAAERVQWQPTVDAVGTLAPIDGAQLALEVPGIIARVNFDNGATVAAGDAILELSAAPDRAELAVLEAAQALAASELERAESLLRERNISESELDRRASELDQARARVTAQKARIEQKTLRAPFAGRLGIRRFNVGAYVLAGDPIVELQALDRLYLNFTLPDSYTPRLEPGMALQAQAQAMGPETFRGRLNAIAPAVDPDTRNIALQAIVDNPDELLRPGMFARVSLALGEPRGQIVVPATAISYRPYGNSVYVLAEQDDATTVRQRFVELGPTRGDMIAVASGLKAGEIVATSGLLKLDGGVPVQVDNTSPPASSLQPQPENR
ncbi:efflux RND transporter periplasmic adaptor subunit [Haliea sp. E1-2-M8]|uniref:efflux RND transporter periplasmic adaptor subunit n=1 Tax=Haliea sp. E1-2-M8 TaxID=3064706 RepID=UPI002724CF11|nr:efflux RND transporter periplasmic adaptor subunit [Haliea sp. E1-2-M8]MDO8862665.1 efflux RND transporter periplasmic adaptor subunit [Haliea sp. E1-2-M8]